MKKLTSLLIAFYLITGCSSGSSTSNGAGAGLTSSEDSSSIYSATLTVESNSVDVYTTTCVSTSEFTEDGSPAAAGIEPLLTTQTATFLVTITDIPTLNALFSLGDITSSLNVDGINMTSYRVTYTPLSPSAPVLSPQTVAKNVLITSSGTSITVITFDLDDSFPEYVRQEPIDGGNIYSYNVTVTYSGIDLNGLPITITATTFIELGSFNTCPGGAVPGPHPSPTPVV